MPLSQPASGYARIAYGSYTGDGNDDRQITTGFKVQCVIVEQVANGRFYCAVSPGNDINTYLDGTPTNSITSNTENLVVCHATDGFSVDNGNVGSANENGVAHYYVAFG